MTAVENTVGPLCCGAKPGREAGGPLVPECQLCPKSASYWQAPSATRAEGEATDFLAWWFDGAPAAMYSLGYNSPDGGFQHELVATLGSLADRAAALDAQDTESIWFRTTTLKHRPEDGRGKAVDSLAMPGLWADLDIVGPGHKNTALPATEEEARLVVKRAGLPEPSAWVHTGGGLAAYWKFTAPLVLDTPEALTEARALSSAWADALIAGSPGVKVDNVRDLARIMRMPGTTNRKVPEAPVDCRVLSLDRERTFESSQLRALLDELSAQHVSAPAAEDESTPAGPAGEVGDPFTAPVASHDAAWCRERAQAACLIARNTRPGQGFNGALNNAALLTGKLVGAGLEDPEFAEQALRWCVTKNWSEPDATDRRTWASGLTAGRKDPWQVAEAASPFAEVAGQAGGASEAGGRGLKVTRASEMPMRATRWLWEEVNADPFTEAGQAPSRWLPLGGLCLLGGREGTGKTTWAYRLAAQVSRGELPGAFLGVPKSVIIAATEDDWSATVVPRLAAADADLERILRVDVEHDGIVEGLTLPADIPALGRLCVSEDVALLILDPLMGAISATLDTHKDAEVRRALEPLSRLAHEARLTILGLIHVNKSQGNDLLTRLMASRAFSAVARAVLFASVEESEIVLAERETFFLGQAKNNLAAKVRHSLRYHIEGRKVGDDEELGEPIFSSRVIIDAAVTGRIDDLLSAQESRKRVADGPGVLAGRWLVEHLTEHGTSPSSDVITAGANCGHAEATLRRRIGKEIISVPIGKGSLWSLPTTT